MINLNEALLDQLLGRLESVRSWSPRVTAKLEALIHASDEYSLFRVNPIQFAAEKGIAEPEAVDLFLHSAKLGIFEIEWHLVCVTCGNVVESFRNMHKLHSTYICNQCSFETTATLDDYIQVSFTISSSIRDVAFHPPESLSADDFLFKYKLSRGVHSWLEGWSHEDLIRAATKLLAYLEPGTMRRVEFPAEWGLVIITDLTNRVTAGFPVTPEPDSEAQRIHIRIAEGQFHFSGREASAGHLDYGYAALSFHHLGQLFAGPLVLEVENPTQRRVCMWMANFTGSRPGRASHSIPFSQATAC